METELSKAEVKRIELDILDFVHETCRKYGISYMLDYGTLLGAVRHKGFIPWDDDVDIAMKRKDYNRFLEVMARNPSPRFKIITSDTDRHYYYEFAKIVDVRTRLQENGILNSSEMGVWVDIFPKDNMPSYHRVVKPIFTLTRLFRIFSVFSKFPDHHSKWWYPIWLVARFTGPRPYVQMNKMLTKVCSKENSDLMGSWIHLHIKYVWNSSMFNDLTTLEFEGKQYNVPVQWDAYLKDLYGDYMKLPPENQRKTHKFVVYWR